MDWKRGGNYIWNRDSLNGIMVALLRVWDRPERIVPKWTLLVVVVVVVNVQMLEVGRPLPLTFPGGGIGQNSNQILIYETLWNVPDSEPWGYAGLLLHFHITRLRFIIALLPWWKSQHLGGIPQFMLLSKLASGLSLRRRRWVKGGGTSCSELLSNICCFVTALWVSHF